MPQPDNNLSPAPITTPLIGFQGLPAQIWILWFQSIYKLLSNLISESGSWTPVFASTQGSINASGIWRAIGNLVFWQVTLTATGQANLAGGSFNIPIQAAEPNSFSAVRTDAYQDFGNGMVSGVTGYLPAAQFSDGTVVLSGWYTK